MILLAFFMAVSANDCLRVSSAPKVPSKDNITTTAMSDLSQLAQIADLHAYRVSEITACFGDNGILTG